VSVDKEIAGIDFLFFLYLTTNSVAICCASAALPPLPKSIILLPFFIDVVQRSKKFLKLLKLSSKNSLVDSI